MAKGDKFYFENFMECAALSEKAANYLVSCLRTCQRMCWLHHYEEYLMQFQASAGVEKSDCSRDGAETLLILRLILVNNQKHRTI